MYLAESFWKQPVSRECEERSGRPDYSSICPDDADGTSQQRDPSNNEDTSSWKITCNSGKRVILPCARQNGGRNHIDCDQGNCEIECDYNYERKHCCSRNCLSCNLRLLGGLRERFYSEIRHHC